MTTGERLPLNCWHGLNIIWLAVHTCANRPLNVPKNAGFFGGDLGAVKSFVGRGNARRSAALLHFRRGELQSINAEASCGSARPDRNWAGLTVFWHAASSPRFFSGGFASIFIFFRDEDDIDVSNLGMFQSDSISAWSEIFPVEF